jgi:hypothetical protein
MLLVIDAPAPTANTRVDLELVDQRDAVRARITQKLNLTSGKHKYPIRAQRDTAAARQIADEYLTDPEVRRNAERFIEFGANGAMFGPPPPRVPPQR